MVNEKTQEKTQEKVDKKEKIEKLKEEIKRIEEEGSFKQVYTMIRKGTVEIMKSETTDENKKVELKKLCQKVVSEIEKFE